MQFTDYQAKYFAFDLTKRCPRTVSKSWIRGVLNSTEINEILALTEKLAA